MKKIKKKQNEEKRDNPSIVAQRICGLDENPELVVEIGRYIALPYNTIKSYRDFRFAC